MFYKPFYLFDYEMIGFVFLWIILECVFSYYNHCSVAWIENYSLLFVKAHKLGGSVQKEKVDKGTRGCFSDPAPTPDFLQN